MSELLRIERIRSFIVILEIPASLGPVGSAFKATVI